MWRDTFSTVRGITAVHMGDSFSTVGGYLQFCGGIASVLLRIFSTVGDNISTVEGIQYSGGRILISACLVINNDEKISAFFVLRYEIFIRKFFEHSS